MAWQRSKKISTPHELPPPVPGTEALRLSLLQASWVRDRSVAQRRVLWRWLVYLVSRYAPHAVILIVLTTGAMYVSSRWSERTHLSLETGSPSPAKAQETGSSVIPPQINITMSAVSADDLDPDSLVPLHLKLGRDLQKGSTPDSPTSTATLTSTDTLSLKPENWLHSKEP